ncbi:hypothetical protein V492_02120 [Pseudogymnoascus sp. VKM F-4246]|nr:hypothetical protein V492_02120 [Pseudogymnoascus sp. VKM F-4246]
MAETFKGTGRIETVVLSGNVETDTKAMMAACGASGADVFIDFSPPVAKGSTHMAAAIGALRRGGRCCFMGGVMGSVEVDYSLIMWKNLRIQGRFMYEREHVVRLIKMLETGTLKLGEAAGVKTLGPYGLDAIEEALEVAEENGKWGQHVVLMPDAASKLNVTIRAHLLIQLVFTVLRVPSLILTVFAIASFSNFFALPDAPNMPQPTKNAIGIATFTLSAISLFLATLCDLAGLYFFSYRKPLRAACTCYLSIRIRLEQVTFWLLICSTFAVIFTRSYQRHSLAAGVPSYEAPQKCFMFLAAMNFVRILFIISNNILGRVVEIYTSLMNARRAAATGESGEELPNSSSK